MPAASVPSTATWVVIDPSFHSRLPWAVVWPLGTRVKVASLSSSNVTVYFTSSGLLEKAGLQAMSPSSVSSVSRSTYSALSPSEMSFAEVSRS